MLRHENLTTNLTTTLKRLAQVSAFTVVSPPESFASYATSRNDEVFV